RVAELVDRHDPLGRGLLHEGDRLGRELVLRDAAEARRGGEREKENQYAANARLGRETSAARHPTTRGPPPPPPSPPPPPPPPPPGARRRDRAARRPRRARR